MHLKRSLASIAGYCVIACGGLGLFLGFEFFRSAARAEAMKNATQSGPYSDMAQNDFVAYLWFAGTILALIGILFLIYRGRDVGRFFDRFRSA